MTADDPSSAADAPESDDDAPVTGRFVGTNRLEDAVVAVSVLLVVGVLGYLAVQAAVTPEAPNPTATVDAVEPTTPGERGAGALRVTVGLNNRGETGLSSVQVVVRCGETERSLTFTHVPARGHRTGTVICRRGRLPTASVATWVEA